MNSFYTARSSRLEGVSGKYFSYFSTKTYVGGTHQKHLSELVQMSTHTIGFCGEIRKISNTF